MKHIFSEEIARLSEAIKITVSCYSGGSNKPQQKVNSLGLWIGRTYRTDLFDQTSLNAIIDQYRSNGGNIVLNAKGRLSTFTDTPGYSDGDQSVKDIFVNDVKIFTT